MRASSMLRRRDSYRNEMYSNQRPAPEISLAPTVGGRVVLSPKDYDLAFILDDQGDEADYLFTIARYMLVGEVLRETSKTFHVRFDIPMYCLPPKLRGETLTRRSVRRAMSKFTADELQQYQAGEEEDEGKKDAEEVAVENANSEEQTVGQQSTRKEAAKQSGTDLLGSGNLSERTNTYNNENTDAFDFQSSPHPHFSDALRMGKSPFNDNKYDECEKGMFSPNIYEIVHVFASPRDLFMQTPLDARQQLTPLLRFDSIPHHNSSDFSAFMTTDRATSARGLKTEGYLHVSLTLAKPSCISLLQYMLYRHDASGMVLGAITAHKFHQATDVLLHIIAAQRAMDEQRRNECRNFGLSLSLACKKDVCTIEPRQVVSLYAGKGWRERLNTILRGSSSADSMTLSSRPFVSLVEHLPSGDIELSDAKSLETSLDTTSPQIMGNPESVTSTKSLVTLLSLQSQKVPCDMLLTGNFTDRLDLDVKNSRRALHLLCGASDAQVKLAPLYTLLSFTRFCSGQYQQSLEDAVTALLHDATYLEAYTRLVTSLMALGNEEEALTAVAVASRRCLALSPQFLRIARAAQVAAYYHRSLPQHSGVEVLPCALQYSGGPARTMSPPVATAGTGASPVADVRPEEVWQPVPRRAMQKTNPSPPCPIPLSARVQQQQQQPQQPQQPRWLCHWNNLVSTAPNVSPLLDALLPPASPPMEFFSRSFRARVVREFETGEIIASEEPSVFIPLWFTYPTTNDEDGEWGDAGPSAGDKEESAVAAMAARRAAFCAHCANPLFTNALPRGKGSFAENLSLIQRCGRTVVPCEGGCGNCYCSDVCRSHAAIAYHAMECVPPVQDQCSCNAHTHAASNVVSDKNACGHDTRVDGPDSHYDHHDSNDSENCTSSSDYCLSEDVAPFLGPCRVDRRALNQRAAISGIRSALSEFRVQVERLVAAAAPSSFSLSFTPSPFLLPLFSPFLSCVLPSTQPTCVAATALLVAGRIVSSVVSLLLPTAAGPFVGCRDRSAALEAIIQRCTAKGIGSAAAPTWDRNSLCLAEEILHELGIPFFADTNYAAPMTTCELTDETITCTTPGAQEEKLPPATMAIRMVLRDGLTRLSGLLRAVDTLVQQYLCDEPLGIVLHGEGAAASACLSDNAPKGGRGTVPPIHEWTCGHLLRFIGRRRFAAQLWDFCLCSHVIIPSNTKFASGPRQEVFVAAVAPLTSMAADLAQFGGAACARFGVMAFGDEGAGASVLLRGREADSMMSLLSITSAQPCDGGEAAAATNLDATTTGTATAGNIEATAGPGRRVTLRAQKPIMRGEELRYEVGAPRYTDCEVE